MFFLFICKLHLKWTKILSNFTAWVCIETTCFHRPELAPYEVIRIPECKKFLLVESGIQESKFYWKGIQNPRPSWITWRRRKPTRSERANCGFCSAFVLLEGEQRTRSSQTDLLRSHDCLFGKWITCFIQTMRIAWRCVRSSLLAQSQYESHWNQGQTYVPCCL